MTEYRLNEPLGVRFQLMSTNNHLLEILKKLSEAQVDYIVAGGVAVVLHGVERATMDLDLSLLLNKENVAKFLSVIASLGMVSRVPVSPSVLADPVQVSKMVNEKHALVFTFIHPENPFQQIDIFLAPHLSYEKLSSGVEIKNIAELKVKILNKETLLALKKGILPPRDKDLIDILALEKLLGKMK